MKLGQVVKHIRSNDICTIVKVVNRKGGYTTCTSQFETIVVAPSTVFMVKFDDGGETLAGPEDLEVI